MKRTNEGPLSEPRDATPELPEFDVESATPEERRRVLEALKSAALDPRVELDPRVFETLAQEVIDPRAEVFAGEAQALLSVLIDEQDGRGFAARMLAQVAVEVGASSDEGTTAGRVALLRCVAGFLLNDRCSRVAVTRRNECARQPE
jgi:hypothetical protein